MKIFLHLMNRADVILVKTIPKHISIICVEKEKCLGEYYYRFTISPIFINYVKG